MALGLTSKSLISTIININKSYLNISRCLRIRNLLPLDETKSLEQRLLELNTKDPEIIKIESLVDIGLPSTRVNKVKEQKEHRKIKAELKSKTLTSLKVNLDEVKEEWKKSHAGDHIRNVAQHFGIYHDLFGHGIFTPKVMLDIYFDYDEETVTPVHRGNVILPNEASIAPNVEFESNPNELWTLILTNPDGHLSKDNVEYIHWFIGNIKGNDLKSGEVIAPYLQPIPVKGSGYQRMIFVLYKQDKIIDYSDFPRPTHEFNLESRTFETLTFYKKYQESLTPAGLAFFQSVWDDSLVDFFHEKLEMNVPVYEYIQEEEYLAAQIKYPQGKSFNKYLDRYREIQDIRKEVLLKRLRMINPLEEEAPMSEYPNIYKNPPGLASWQKPDLWKERNRIGKFRDLRPHSSFEQSEFDFNKMYNTSVDNKK